MSDDQTPPEQPPQGNEPQRVPTNVRQDRAQTNYANLAMLATTPEEVVLNFGVRLATATPQPHVDVEITSRIIMSYPSAKRLALMLSNAIQRYESQQGKIEVGPQPPSAPPAPQDPTLN